MNKTKIKICGITEEKEIDRLIELNCDYAGFVVFFEKSKRNNTIDKAGELVKYINKKRKEMNGCSIKTVAVVVSPDIEQLKLIEAAGFDILQVHGAFLSDVKEKCHIPIFRALNIADKNEDEINEAVNDEKISGIVLDGEIAGSGHTFRWDLFKRTSYNGKEFILAGGLNKDNVSDAVRCLHPDTVDVSSGVEYDDKSKSGKDLKKINQFVKAVRNIKE